MEFSHWPPREQQAWASPCAGRMAAACHQPWLGSSPGQGDITKLLRSERGGERDPKSPKNRICFPSSFPQSQPRLLGLMWRSSNSRSNGACDSAINARGAQRAVFLAREAQIPPRHTPPSRSMATQDQEQFESPWSPRIHLTGLIHMNLWGRTAGMATMRLTSAQTAVSIASRTWGSSV